MVSREELYELVWSVPMVRVAEKFKVSGSYMARVCSTLHVPRPERGYWAKLAVGKAPEKPSLPDAQPGEQLSWSQEGELPSPPRPHLSAPSPRPPCRELPRPVKGIHGLIRDAKGHFSAAEGANVAIDADWLRKRISEELKALPALLNTNPDRARTFLLSRVSEIRMVPTHEGDEKFYVAEAGWLIGGETKTAGAKLDGGLSTLGMVAGEGFEPSTFGL